MGIKFASDEWMAALKNELGKSDAYRDAAKTWEGDFYWIVTGMPGEAPEVYLYVDLWHGEADANVSISAARYLAEAIPDCRARFLPGNMLSATRPAAHLVRGLSKTHCCATFEEVGFWVA